MSSPRIFCSAGEASGDLIGASLVEAIRERHPEAQFAGLGGPRMRAAGVRLLAEPERLAVVGFVEVVRHLPFFLGLRRLVSHELDQWRPDLVIPIDYPGFNLRLAQMAHRRGLRVLYYIAPQVWAWRWGRVRTLAAATDALAVVFPFEEPLLRREGVQAHFVGHPLVERSRGWPSRADARRRLGVPEGTPLLGVFPGSRKGEVRRLLSPFLDTARRLKAEYPGLRIGVAQAAGVDEALYRATTSWATLEESTTLLCASTAILTKSGTTTLEAAFAGTPLVVAYRVHPVTYTLARRVVRIPYIAMVNLLAGRRVVPEFVQREARPERLAEALAPLLREGEARDRMVADLEEVRRGLGSQRASKRTAALVDEMLGERLSAAGAASKV